MPTISLVVPHSIRKAFSIVHPVRCSIQQYEGLFEKHQSVRKTVIEQTERGMRRLHRAHIAFSEPNFCFACIRAYVCWVDGNGSVIVWHGA